MADEPVELLVLDSDELSALAALHPSVADALTGERDDQVGPEGGERLSRAKPAPPLESSAGSRRCPRSSRSAVIRAGSAARSRSRHHDGHARTRPAITRRSGGRRNRGHERWLLLPS